MEILTNIIIAGCSLVGTIFGFIKLLQKQFEKLEKKFDKIDQRFDKIDQRFEEVRKDIAQLDSRVNHLENRLERVESELKVEIRDLTKRIDQLFFMRQVTDYDHPKES